MAKLTAKQQREYAKAEAKRVNDEKHAQWLAEREAKKQEGSDVSKALFRLLELKEVLECADKTVYDSCFTVVDEFDNETEIKLSDLHDLFKIITDALEPEQTIANGTTSLFDEIEPIKAENERLKSLAAELAEYLPLDRYYQQELGKDIWSGAASFATFNIPLFADHKFMQ